SEYYVRGSTALLDAIGKAINHIGNIHKFTKKEEVPDKTLFVITTDGMENASEEYSYALVNKMIQRQTEKYGWEFVFLGANMDAVSVAARMGIRAERSATFHNDSVGIGTNYTAVSRIMDSLRFKEEFDDGALEEIRRDYQKRK
ncbi:MAG: hypothetical protein IJ875_00745, partial [Solobacterium sp.]|nr:hypothetical protein [Solobacterium sp.]